MLHWSVAFVILPAVAISLAVSRPFRSLLAKVTHRTHHGLNCLAARLSAALDVVLRPSDHDGRSGWSRLVLWTVLNAGAMAGIYHFRETHNDVASMSSAALLTCMHVMLAAATILAIAEDNRIMHLGQPRANALFGMHAAVRDATVIGLETVLSIASASVLLDMLSLAMPGAIIVSFPDTGSTFADHLICLLSALPVTGTLVAMTEFAPQISYGGAYGSTARAIIYFMGSSLIIGAAAAWILQRNATGLVLAQLEDADSDDAHFLQLILSRAPPHIKVALLVLALDSTKPLVQLRAINVMRHLKVWTFPQTFLHHLGRFERKVAIVGLNRIREFLTADGAAFDEVLLVTGTRKAFGRYIELASSIDKPIEDAVLSRLGGLISDYISLLQSRQIDFRTTNEQYRVMLAIAKAHKDIDVRRAMSKSLMARGAKGFLTNYLVNMQDRDLNAVDVEIIEKFAAFVRAEPDVLSNEEHAIVTKRLLWNLRHAGLNVAILKPLRDLQMALQAVKSECVDN